MKQSADVAVLHWFYEKDAQQAVGYVTDTDGQPVEVLRLARTYTAGGGNPDTLRAALDND